MQGLSQMMQQYFNIKQHHKEHIVFYRLGDFYEMFFEDAILAAKELELTLTGRDCGLSERAPMCGVPHHSAEGYIARLIKKGYKVAICEQMENPATAKGVVSRAVVRVVTPGTLLENQLLEEDNNNYLCCIYRAEQGYGVAFADVSTGEIDAAQLPDSDLALTDLLSRFMPREVIFNSALVERGQIAKFMREKLLCTADLLEDEPFAFADAEPNLLAHFGCADLGELKLDEKPLCVSALGGLLHYLKQTQKIGLERMHTIQTIEDSRYMRLDASTRTNLELLQKARAKEKKGSLLWVLDKTRTPMGKRLIKSYISQPLIHIAEIERRLNAVDALYQNEVFLSNLMEDLGGVFDVERMLTRVVYGNATPREYKTLEQTMRRFPALKASLEGAEADALSRICREIDPLQDVCDLLARAIGDEPPNTLKDGGVIRTGYNAELDEQRELMNNAKAYLSRLENQERENTGIKNLKIRYNRVFGYYIEVTKSYLTQVPETYIRKQTLANCERYIIQELKELEERILTAQEHSVSLESALFEEVRGGVTKELHRIQRTASAIARLDVFCSFARVSLDNRYVRPVIAADETLAIQDGRHPVVELTLDGAPFVPNDTLLDTADNQIAIITGPNMAGKSTYMRQTALIVLMAQIGCFVPAKSATIGIVDGIYTRIGAADDLAAGQSTFMVEMVEVAEIIRHATRKSLLILDEIGRGTSTYDGMSIARAIIEYIADPKKLGAKTLFATHYHELTVMEDQLPHVKNYNIVAKKRGDDIIFLRKIVRGGTDDSYGIEVSKLAGIPTWIVRRAHEILLELEADAAPYPEQGVLGGKANRDTGTLQISFEKPLSPLEEKLKNINLDTITPIEALTFLHKLKEERK